MNDKLSLSIIAMYYALMGANVKNVDLEELYRSKTYLSEISPLKSKNIIIPKDDLSLDLDLDINFFLKRVFGSEIHLDDKYNYNFEKEYIDSVIQIINTISKIKLIAETSENYTLEFQRMSYLLHISFSEINTQTISMPKDISKIIEQKDYIKIRKFINMCPNLTLLILLAMKMDNESHKIFYTEESYKINFAKIMTNTRGEYEVSPDFQIDNGIFTRTTYDKALKLTKIS